MLHIVETFTSLNTCMEGDGGPLHKGSSSRESGSSSMPHAASTLVDDLNGVEGVKLKFPTEHGDGDTLNDLSTTPPSPLTIGQGDELFFLLCACTNKDEKVKE